MSDKPVKKEVFDYRDGFMEASAEVERLMNRLVADRVACDEKMAPYLELQKAAEAIEGPGDWFHKDVRPAIVALHKAIRKVRGMG